MKYCRRRSPRRGSWRADVLQLYVLQLYRLSRQLYRLYVLQLYRLSSRSWSARSLRWSELLTFLLLLTFRQLFLRRRRRPPSRQVVGRGCLRRAGRLRIS